MRQVPSLLFGYMKDTLSDAGCDVEAAMCGLALEGTRPRIGLRVDWDEVATFLNRATAHLSDEEAEAVGERYVRVNRYLSAVFGVVTRPSIWYRLTWLASRNAFPHIRFQAEGEGDELTLSMTLPEAFEACPFFFRGTVGELRAMPRLLRLPDAEVSAELTPRSGRYRISLRAPERTWGELGLSDGEAWLVEDLLGVLPEQRHDDAGDDPTLVYALQRRHGLTRAEARVATRLAEGMAVPDIAQDLHVSVETVRTHLKRAYGKAGVRRQAELVRFVLALEGKQDA